MVEPDMIATDGSITLPMKRPMNIGTVQHTSVTNPKINNELMGTAMFLVPYVTPAIKESKLTARHNSIRLMMSMLQLLLQPSAHIVCFGDYQGVTL